MTGSRPVGKCQVCGQPVWKPKIIGGKITSCPPCWGRLRARWHQQAAYMQTFLAWLTEPADAGDYAERLREGTNMRARRIGIETVEDRTQPFDTDDPDVDIGLSNTPKRRPNR
jgi:hypothetical protein